MTGPDNQPIVVFADALGAALVMDALPAGMAPPLLVFDPRRGISSMLPMLPMPPASLLAHPDASHRPAFLAALAAAAPRLAIICSYSRILWPELIAAFPCGVVNVHNSRLPDYRGANTLQWTLINGETQTDATLHYVDQGVDTGPVIDRVTLDIAETDDALSLRGKLCAAGQALLVRWIDRLLTGPVPARRQPQDQARSWPRRRPEDGCIDWSWPDERIRNLTRALVSPWPGAFTQDEEGRRIVFDRALSLAEVRDLRRQLRKDGFL